MGAALGGAARGATIARQSLSKGRMIGGSVGNIAGAGMGLAHGLKKDEEGKRHVIRGIGEGILGSVLGGILGGGVGSGVGNIVRATRKTASVPLWKALTKTAEAPPLSLYKLADSWGRQLAREDGQKIKTAATKTALPANIAGMGQKLLGGARAAWGGLPAAQRTKMLVGAGAGALAGGAATAHDEHGFHPLRAIGGALGGAALGGAAGGVAHNVMGQGLKGGLQQTAQQAKGIATGLTGPKA
jgi:hypothetical protein